jgi:hypothetical protein
VVDIERGVAVCVVCLEPLEWVATGRCGHRALCPKCMVAVRAAGNKRLCCVCGARCPYVVVTKADAWDASLLSRMPITMREGEHSTYWYNRRTGAYFHDSDQYYAVSRAAGKIPLPFYQPTVRFRLQFFFLSPTSRSEIKLKLHLTMFFFSLFRLSSWSFALSLYSLDTLSAMLSRGRPSTPGPKSWPMPCAFRFVCSWLASYGLGQGTAIMTTKPVKLVRTKRQGHRSRPTACLRKKIWKEFYVQSDTSSYKTVILAG